MAEEEEEENCVNIIIYTILTRYGYLRLIKIQFKRTERKIFLLTIKQCQHVSIIFYMHVLHT